MNIRALLSFILGILGFASCYKLEDTTPNYADGRSTVVYDLPYYSFRYMVVKADERRFGFVKRNSDLSINLTTKKHTVTP